MKGDRFVFVGERRKGWPKSVSMKSEMRKTSDLRRTERTRKLQAAGEVRARVFRLSSQDLPDASQDLFGPLGRW